MSIPHNIVMNPNNVMAFLISSFTPSYKTIAQNSSHFCCPYQLVYTVFRFSTLDIPIMFLKEMPNSNTKSD